MPSFNQVTILGNLTRDPEVKFSPKGTAICVFSLAVNRRWTTEAGEKMEEATFFDCKAFGRAGEVIAEHSKKGDALFVQGRMSLEEWEDKQTRQRRSKMVAIINEFEFLTPKPKGIPSTLREDS